MTVYAVLDLETTGLDPREGHRIIEVAVLGLDDRLRETFRFETLVAVDRPVGPTHIHGLSAADLVGAPTFEQAAPHLGDLLQDAVLVAHYPRFDLGFLDAELARLGHGLPACGVIDSRDLCRSAGVRGSLKHVDCCAALGVSNSHAHAAMGDVEATVELIRACAATGVDITRHVLQWGARPMVQSWPAPSSVVAPVTRAA